MFVVGGESLIDLVSEPRNGDGGIRMQAHQGGSPYNCAIALSRLGKHTGFLCPISKDGFGAYLLEPLTAAGVEPLVAERVAEPSTLAVVTLDAEGRAQYEFYRGAEKALTAEAGRAALPDAPELFQFGGFGPIEPETAAVWLDLAEAALARGAVFSIDPNVRPSLIADPEGYRARLSRFLELAHIVKVSEEDLAWLDASKSIDAHVEALLARANCKLVVVTLGEKGSRAYTSAGQAVAGVHHPAVFGDTVGAGDSLMAGVLAALADGGHLQVDALGKLGAAELAAILEFGAVVAGLNCAHKGCVPPSRAEVEAVLASR